MGSGRNRAILRRAELAELEKKAKAVEQAPIFKQGEEATAFMNEAVALIGGLIDDLERIEGEL